MRSDAKPPTAGSNQRRARGLGRVFRGSFAGRGSSLGVDGGSASSRGVPLAALSLLAALLATALLATPASASKEIINEFGDPVRSGPLGGQFNFPGEIAVNRSGVGAPKGTIYVADESNHRVQRFDAGGNFVSAWGKDVISAAVNERQLVRIGGATGGSFTLTLEGATTSPIPSNASANQVAIALAALPTVAGNANVEAEGFVSGGTVVVFRGALAGTDLPTLEADSSQLVGGEATVTPLADGVPTVANDTGTGFEVCTVATECKTGVASGGDGTAAGNGALDDPQSVAVDDDTGNVYVSDRDNRRIDAYDADGEFLFSVGRDVAEPDGGTEVEVCDGETEVCRKGDAGTGVGAIGTGGARATLGIAVSQADGNPATGSIFLADTGNRRVGVYDLDGSNPGSFGSAANFASTQPRRVAVDSRGIVYAGDTENGGELERYDSEGVNGPVGFLAPISPGSPEVQVISRGTVSGGEGFSLTCPDGTVAPPVPSSNTFSGRVEQMLEAACGVHFQVSGNNTTATVTFRGGTYGDKDVPTTICTALEPGESCSVTEEVDGVPGALLSGSFSIANAGLAVDPDSDGAGPDEDVLFVNRGFGSGISGIVQQFGPGEAPGLASPPSVDDDRHAGEGTGLAVNAAGDRLYLTDSSLSIHRVYVLADPATLPPPVLVLGAATTVTDTGAAFTGSVDPGPAKVSCTLQFSTDFGFANPSEVAVPGCEALASEGGPQQLQTALTGLDPNTKYFVRLQARWPRVSESTVSSAPQSFTTAAPPPVLSDVGAIQVKNTSVRLVGTIDPRNNPTGYIFEYGTSPAMGSATAPLGIGGGTDPIVVSQVVSGLKPGAEYYFRLVATNLSGSTASSGQSFHTRATAPPSPGGRSWEMVTPPEKNYTDADNGIFIDNNQVAVAPDGEAVAFCTSALFGEPPSQLTNLCAPYIARRSGGGWGSSHPFPKFCKIDPGTGASNAFQNVGLAPDFSHFVVTQPESDECPVPRLDPAAPTTDDPETPTSNLYYEDPGADPFAFHLMNSASPTSPVDTQNRWVGGSEDFSTIAYISSGNQTADSPPPSNVQKIYLWQKQGVGGCVQPGGCVHLVSKDPAGNAFTTESGIATPHLNYGGRRIEANTVSKDGQRVFFQNPISESYNPLWTLPGECDVAGCDLYVREGNTTTVKVSESECTLGVEACGNPQTAEDRFLYSTPSGEYAFFRSGARLTDAPGGGLYRWDATAPAGARLVKVSGGPVELPSGTGTANFGAMIGASDDGDTVFFASVAGFFSPDVGDLYRWQWNGGSPTTEYLGRHDRVAATEGVADHNTSGLRRLVTPDGKHLLHYSQLRLDPAADGDADVDVYRWSEDGGWTCVSCQEPGAPSGGHVALEDMVLWHYEAPFVALSSLERRVLMSDDGERIFFATPDPLVPGDVNGEAGCSIETDVPRAADRGYIHTCDDVYEWHDGTVSLVSSGTGTSAARLIATTPSGDDVFFFTRQKLVGWDVDKNIDIYDARLGGGFPEPAAQPPECEGEGCRGEGSETPAVTGAGTAVFQGAGNARSEASGNRCPANRLRRGKRCLSPRAIARKRCRRLSGVAKRRCVRRQTRRLRRAQRRRAQRRARAHRANFERRAGR